MASRARSGPRRGLARWGALVAFGLVVLGALAALSSPAAAQGSAVDRLLARAERASERGRQRRALRLVRRAIRRAEPEDCRPGVALADLLPTDPSAVAQPDEALRERAAEAAEALETCLASAPERGGRGSDSAGADADTAERRHAWAIAASGDHQQAIERAAGRAGLQDRPGAEGLRRLATVAVLRDDLTAARRALEAALRSYPQDSAILSDLGAVELALGDAESAIGRFERVLGRHPEDLSTRRDLAGALVAAGRAAGAVELLAQALEAHPEAVDVRLELAHAALEAGAPARAARAAQAAIEALPEDDARGHSVLGAALAAAGRAEEAEAAFTEALRRDPGDVRARRGLEALREPEASARRESEGRGDGEAHAERDDRGRAQR